VKDLTGTHKTVIIVAFLAAIVGLSFLGKDTAALIAVGTAILAGIGFSVAQGTQIQQQTNGALKAKDEAFQQYAAETSKHLRELANKMAEMTPPPKG
jgi:hypothetical protein